MSPKIITMASGKGGVGKTVLSANLARIFQRHLGQKVLLVDGDFALSNIDILMDLKSDLTMDDFLYGMIPLEEIIIKTKYGVDVLPASSGVREMRELSVEQRRRLTYSLEDISCGYDVILIDCPSGVAKDTLQICAVSHKTILTVNPEPTSLTDTYAFIKLMKENYRENHFTIIVNKVRSEEEAKSIYRRLLSVTSDFLGISMDYLGYLPYDERVKDSVQARQLLVDRSPHITPVKLLKDIGKNIFRVENPERIWNGGLKALWPHFLPGELTGSRP